MSDNKQESTDREARQEIRQRLINRDEARERSKRMLSEFIQKQFYKERE